MDRLYKFDSSIFDGIIKTQAYFDSIKFRLTRKVFQYHFCDNHLKDELRDCNGMGSVELVKIPMPYQKNDLTGYVLDIKQPTADALMCLIHRVQHTGPIRMNYAEIALDHIFNTLEEAERFQKFLVQTLIQGNNKQSLHVRSFRTVYTKRKYENGRRSDRNIVIYADKGARLFNDAPCCHLEVRLANGTSLERMGLVSPLDPIKFDFKPFFEKSITLFDIADEDALQKLATSVMERKKDKSSWWLRAYKLPRGKIVEVDFRKRVRRSLLNMATVDLHHDEVVSAHNLKLAANFWNVRLNSISERDDYMRRITDRRYRSSCKPYFETDFFDRIDASRMLDMDSVYAD